MKPKHIFWGVLLVTLGTLILISNFTLIDLDLSRLWKLWPAALILWGISFILNKEFIKVVFAGVIGLVLALTIFGAGQSILNVFDKDFDVVFDDDNWDGYADTTKFVEEYDKSIEKADLKIDAGAGSFKLLEPSTDLVSIIATGTKDNYKLSRKTTAAGTEVELKMIKKRIKFRKGGYKNRVQMNLNSNPLWNLDIDLGAAAIDFDLSPYKIGTLKLDIGAASLDIKIGDKNPQTYIDIDAGASSIDISVPDSSGCEIVSDVTISSKHFNGFEKINKKLYRTDNFDTAKNKIYLKLDAGVSSIEVNRYSGEW